MSGIVAIGEERQVAGYALAGATALAADDETQARAAWESLPPDTALVLLSATAYAALRDAVRERPLLWVVLPE